MWVTLWFTSVFSLRFFIVNVYVTNGLGMMRASRRAESDDYCHRC